VEGVLNSPKFRQIVLVVVLVLVIEKRGIEGRRTKTRTRRKRTKAEGLTRIALIDANDWFANRQQNMPVLGAQVAIRKWLNGRNPLY
jgi:hypothetical protein